jgi:alginate O-acetyltransferase complex protein AlgI
VIYSSVPFIVAFAVFGVIFWAIRRHTARLALLLVASFGFYAYGEPSGLVLLAAVITLTYLCGLAISRWPGRASLIVAFGISMLLALLGYYKYSAFAAGLFRFSFAAAPATVPLGLSFYTFEAVSYLMDIRRHVTTVERSALRFSLFISVFPHLISGPIMRPNGFLPQLRTHFKWRTNAFVSGLQLFVEGLAKKRLLADPCGVIADQVFAAPGQASTAAAWIAALAYTTQIYGDFAGYTDMGRGVARMLGFELPLNFNAPYAARSVRDFWQRWHISLSTWLRDYVYISLGGNRHGAVRTYVNLMVTMLLGGLWHGAGLTWIAWGGYHGLLLSIERATRWPDRLPVIVGTIATLALVVNGWVLFRARDFGTALELLRAMYTPTSGASLPTSQALFVLATFSVVFGAMLLQRYRAVFAAATRRSLPRVGWAYGLVAGVALVVMVLEIAPQPFIYFRF